MRRIILAAIMAVAGTGAAGAAGAGWHGPGWYVCMDTPVKPQSMYRGSYRTKEDCEKAMPEPHGAISYECIEFTHEPIGND